MSRRTGSTKKKHGGLAFNSPALVFDDPHAIFRKDRVVAGEQRRHVIGMSFAALLLVVHIYCMENEHDQEETIRIISAREANKRECQIYFQQAGD